jgi:hypothetical protein
MVGTSGRQSSMPTGCFSFVTFLIPCGDRRNGPDLSEAYRQEEIYAAKIHKGAKTDRLTSPTSGQGEICVSRADEVIE